MLGPRLGIAWRPTEKTVVRAGYGIVYDSMMGQIQTFQANVGAWPDATNTQLSFNPIGGALTTVQQLQSLSASALPTATPWSTENWMYDPHIKPARSYQWNMGIQRQMTHNLMLSIAYVGATSDRLNVTGLFNVATAPTNGTAAAIKALTPFPWAATTFMGESIGSAHYNSLQFSAEKRYSSWLAVPDLLHLVEGNGRRRQRVLRLLRMALAGTPRSRTSITLRKTGAFPHTISPIICPLPLCTNCRRARASGT